MNDILQAMASGIARAFARVRLKFSMWYVRKGYNWSKDLRKDCINFIWKNQLILNQWNVRGKYWADVIPSDFKVDPSKTVFDSNKYGVTNYTVGNERAVDIPGYRFLINDSGYIMEKTTLSNNLRFFTVKCDTIAVPLICIMRTTGNPGTVIDGIAHNPATLVAWTNANCDIYPMIPVDRGYDGSKGALVTFGDQLYGVDHPDNQGLFIDIERFRKGGCYDH